MKYPKIKTEILTPLEYRDLLNGKDVEIISPFLVKVVLDYSTPAEIIIEVLTIEVPKKFISDLASVPRFLQGLIPRFGKYNAAAVAHDWLFIHGKITGRVISRALTDRIFLAIMRETKCGWRKKLMYTAVRMFGKCLWDKNRKNDK